MSPRTQEQNDSIREISRAKIVETALKLFAQYGYESTSVRMIAQAAGIAQGLLYNYFESKEALLATVVEQSMADVRESFDRAEAGEEPKRQIERLIRAAFEMVQQKQAFWKLIYGVRMQGAVMANIGDGLVGEAMAIRATLERYCLTAELPQPAIEAAILFALIDGVAQHYVLDPEHYPIDAVADALVARYNALIAQQGDKNEPGVA